MKNLESPQNSSYIPESVIEDFELNKELHNKKERIKKIRKELKTFFQNIPLKPEQISDSSFQVELKNLSEEVSQIGYDYFAKKLTTLVEMAQKFSGKDAEFVSQNFDSFVTELKNTIDEVKIQLDHRQWP